MSELAENYEPNWEALANHWFGACSRWEAKWQEADHRREQAEQAIRIAANRLGVVLEFPLTNTAVLDSAIYRAIAKAEGRGRREAVESMVGCLRASIEEVVNP